MPKGSLILIVRHGEKPTSGPRLAPAGEQRAAAYVPFFKSFKPFGGELLLRLDYLFAAADSEDSHRPRLTIEPLARALNKPIDLRFADKHYEKLAKVIRDEPRYELSKLLICWHHEEVLPLAAALGVEPQRLPPQARWPKKWDPLVYGWVLVIAYDDQGGIDLGRTMCLSEKLMYGDCGQEPLG
jgi:hypothetical protein